MSIRRVQRIFRSATLREDVNVYAAAFLLTESKFRGFLFRIGEAVYTAALLTFSSQEPRLTLGTAQISFRFWRQRFGKNHFRLLLATFSDRENYELCCEFLRPHAGRSARDLIIIYNGRPSLLYATTFSKNLKLCELVAEQILEARRTD
jgi:hypothetical protein